VNVSPKAILAMRRTALLRNLCSDRRKRSTLNSIPRRKYGARAFPERRARGAPITAAHYPVNALGLQPNVALRRDAFNARPGVRDIMPQTTLVCRTEGPGLYEFTDEIAAFVAAVGADVGLLTIFVRHTSCSLLIQENADPDVQRDLDTFFHRLVPPADDPSMRWVVHTTEGPDDMPAHIKAALTQTSLGVPVSGGRMVLGTWQGIYLFEHRQRPHRREIVLHVGP
jgi:secondary thiamine-phosphate synthase enzyme